jgi:hypothetical protein
MTVSSFKNTFVLLTGCLVIQGCASQSRVYKFELAGRYQLHVEKPTIPLDASLSQSLGRSVTAVEGDVNQIKAQALGGYFGVTEQMGIFFSRAGFYSVDYPSISYTFNIQDVGEVKEDISAKTFGVEFALGMLIAQIIRPYLAVKYEKETATTLSGGLLGQQKLSTTGNYLGAGLGIDIPLAKTFAVVIDGLYLTGSDVNGKAEDTSINVGVRFDAFEIK